MRPTRATRARWLCAALLSAQARATIAAVDPAHEAAPAPSLNIDRPRHTTLAAEAVRPRAVPDRPVRVEAVAVAAEPGPASRLRSREFPTEPTLSSADGLSYENAELEGRPARGKRWEGWDTSTSTVYVTATQDVPTVITRTTTYGESPVVDGGTTTETVYKGESTLTVPGPSYLTLTFYPTTTTYETSRTTIPTATKTKTSGTQPDSRGGSKATSTVCAPEDSEEKEYTGLKPTHDQAITLYVIAIYIVGIAIGWNLFILRDLLFPCKTFTVGVHEVGHVLFTICLGYRIGLFTINPKDGGLTRTKSAVADVIEPIPVGALPAGYLFSIIVGGLLTFCGFDTLASKVASFIVGIGFVAVFLWVDVLPKLLTIATVGLMIGLWFVDHAWGLRFFILFLGVMNSFYVLWDVADDAFFAKQNPCCPALHFEVFPRLSPALWTIIYVVASFLLFVGFILAALATWKETPHAMYCEAQSFLPTR